MCIILISNNKINEKKKERKRQNLYETRIKFDRGRERREKNLFFPNAVAWFSLELVLDVSLVLLALGVVPVGQLAAMNAFGGLGK